MLDPLTSNAIFGPGPSSVTGVDDISGQIQFVGGRRTGSKRAAQAAPERCSSGYREATAPAFRCSGISVRPSPGLTGMQISSKPFDRRGIQAGDGSIHHCRIGRLEQPVLRPEADHISGNEAGAAPVGHVGAQMGNVLRPAHGCFPTFEASAIPRPQRDAHSRWQYNANIGATDDRRCESTLDSGRTATNRLDRRVA